MSILEFTFFVQSRREKYFRKLLDKFSVRCYTMSSQTVEAEIKTIMTSQRAREDESRVRNKSSADICRFRMELNGPLRVQSKEETPSILQRMAYVSCREYRTFVPYFASARVTVNQGGTADNDYSSLTEYSVEDFLFVGGCYEASNKTMVRTE